LGVDGEREGLYYFAECEYSNIATRGARERCGAWRARWRVRLTHAGERAICCPDAPLARADNACAAGGSARGRRGHAEQRIQPPRRGKEPMPMVRPKEEVVAQALKAIAHPTRLRLLKHMAEGPLCVWELQKSTGLRQPNISQHLAILRDRGLVIPERRGNMTCYHLANKRIARLITLAEALFAGERGQGAASAGQGPAQRMEASR